MDKSKRYFLSPEFAAEKNLNPAIMKYDKFKPIREDGEYCYIVSCTTTLVFYIKKTNLIFAGDKESAPDYELRYALAQRGLME